jgi:hypothetical protein
VDDFLKRERACDECRRNAIQRGPEELANLMVDLEMTAEKRLADREAELETAGERLATALATASEHEVVEESAMEMERQNMNREGEARSESVEEERLAEDGAEED